MKKLVAIIAIIAMAFTGCTTGCNKENEVINETPENPEVVSNEVENQGAKEYRVTDETVNAYDFIIETMSKPQYYSDEQYKEHTASWEEAEIDAYYEELGLKDRTAWVLIDEETATFRRGYRYILTLNFADYTAILSSGYTDIKDEKHFDFKNNEFYWVDGESGERVQDITYIHATGKPDEAIELIRRCFDEYKELFEKAGCPLAGEPKGTLTKYKNKQIQKVEEVNDGLIHAIWEQEGFYINLTREDEGRNNEKLIYKTSWETSPDVVWLDDYRDIQYAKAPESDYRESFNIDSTAIGGTIEHVDAAFYSPVFLVLADKSDNAQRYSNAAEFLALYYFTPMLKNIYGYNAVYFADRTKVPDGEWQVSFAESKEEFEKGFSTPTAAIVPILNQGTLYVAGRYTLDSVCDCSYADEVYERIEGLMKDMCDYYGKEYIFGDDYYYNFQTIFDSGVRELLGLM